MEREKNFFVRKGVREDQESFCTAPQIGSRKQREEEVIESKKGRKKASKRSLRQRKVEFLGLEGLQSKKEHPTPHCLGHGAKERGGGGPRCGRERNKGEALGQAEKWSLESISGILSPIRGEKGWKRIPEVRTS